MKNRLVWGMRPSATLRSALGRGELKHPQRILILGWWSLVLFKLSIYKPRIRCHHTLFLFAVMHSVFFFCCVAMIELNFLLSWIHVFQQTFKGSLGRPMAGCQEKNPTNPRVNKMMDQFFFQKSYAIVYEKKTFILWLYS